MQAKEYLEQVQRAEEELKLLNAEKAHYLEMATSTGVKLDGMPHNPNVTSRVENAAVSMADLISVLDARINEYVNLIGQARFLIQQIQPARFRQLLTLKYMLGMSWPEVRAEMHYSDEKSVYRVHGYALKEFDKVLTNHRLT